MNQAFSAPPDAPGGIATKILNAKELGREIGQIEHDVRPRT